MNKKAETSNSYHLRQHENPIDQVNVFNSQEDPDGDALFNLNIIIDDNTNNNNNNVINTSIGSVESEISIELKDIDKKVISPEAVVLDKEKVVENENIQEKDEEEDESLSENQKF